MLTDKELAALRELEWEIRAGPGNEPAISDCLRRLGCSTLPELALKLVREVLEVTS